MASFSSTYTNKIDGKGRVSVPAAFRAALGEEADKGLFLYPSPSFPNAIEGLGRAVFDRSAERENGAAAGEGLAELFEDSEDGVAEYLNELGHTLLLDAEGRVVLPPGLAGPAGISEAAVFVGRGKRFQVWAPEPYARRREQLLEQFRDRFGRRAGP